MWQAEAVKELTLSASPATAVGEQTLTLANRRYSTVLIVELKFFYRTSTHGTLLFTEFTCRSIKNLPVKNAVQVGMRNELHVIDTSDPNTEFEMYGTKILPPNRT